MEKEMKTLVFDMDGTIADLYGVENWLHDLRMESVRPYTQAKPIYDMELLNDILLMLKACGWRIVVTSWLAKESSNFYNEITAIAKYQWLKKYNFPFDEVHFVPYGTEKSSCTDNISGYQVLVDDNEEVRNSWKNGSTIDATKNILKSLVDLLV